MVYVFISLLVYDVLKTLQYRDVKDDYPWFSNYIFIRENHLEILLSIFINYKRLRNVTALLPKTKISTTNLEKGKSHLYYRVRNFRIMILPIRRQLEKTTKVISPFPRFRLCCTLLLWQLRKKYTSVYTDRRTVSHTYVLYPSLLIWTRPQPPSKSDCKYIWSSGGLVSPKYREPAVGVTTQVRWMSEDYTLKSFYWVK